jgi:hypothetical protein
LEVQFCVRVCKDNSCKSTGVKRKLYIVAYLCLARIVTSKHTAAITQL